jgi:thiol-disulfide isomerase/thioredoxin
MSANPSDPTTAPNTTTPNTTTRLRNFAIAVVAIFLSVAIVLGLRTESGVASLTEQAQASTPLEVALSNDKPTLMEFYANWCTTCQAMAPQMQQLKESYADRINFVMLNVDNTKWLPEMTEYNVDGIPHFVFIDRSGKALAQVIGEPPRTVLAENLDALIANHTALPHDRITGPTSDFDPNVVPNPGSSDDPRSHGGS